MESPKSQSEEAVPRSENTSCWTKKKKTVAERGVMSNFKDHLDVFVSTPMDQHKICLKKTMHDLREYIKLKKTTYGSLKVDTEADSGAKEASSPPSAKATAAH